MPSYRGREIDAIALWEEYVDFPPNMDTQGPFLPKVKCPNPNHDTLKRHFQINVSQTTVHCFAGCGISGSYEHAIMVIEGCSRAEARRKIVRRSRIRSSVGTRHTGTRAKRNPEPASVVPDLALYSFLPEVAKEYLTWRGISDSSIAQWELGWNSETKRITIPVRDSQNRLKFVIERAVLPSQFPKYLYPEHSEKSSVLFGACFLNPGMVRSSGILLVEGSLDAIRLHQNGISSVVAILGSTLSKKQAEIIGRMRPKVVTTMFDKDSSGIGATFSVKQKLPRIPIYVCKYPKGCNDPAELTREEAHRSISRAVPFSTFASQARSYVKGEVPVGNS